MGDEFIPQKDYIIQLDSNNDAGIHECSPVVIYHEDSPCNNYNITCNTGTYTINKFTEFNKAIVANIEPQEYTGNPIAPKVNVSYTFKDQAIQNSIVYNEKSVVFEEGKDYVVSYSNNVNPGKANIFIEGIGSCEGSIQACFDIVPGQNYSEFITNTSDSLSVYIIIAFSIAVLSCFVFLRSRNKNN